MSAEEWDIVAPAAAPAVGDRSCSTDELTYSIETHELVGTVDSMTRDCAVIRFDNGITIMVRLHASTDQAVIVQGYGKRSRISSQNDNPPAYPAQGLGDGYWSVEIRPTVPPLKSA
jgi:hypothetical protein